MKKNMALTLMSMLLLGIFVVGCGGGGGGSDGASGGSSVGDDSGVTNPPQPTVVNIAISGSVNDAPVPFAEVRLVLVSSNQTLATLQADKNGNWSHTIDKSTIPADDFIMIYATRPENGVVIRSAIDTDDVLASTDLYIADQTTVSHYTEAIIILMETDGGLDQENFDSLMRIVQLDNGEPIPTGSEELDAIADTVQESLEDDDSSHDQSILNAYGELLEQSIAKTVPDEHGNVDLELPADYNDKVTIDVGLSVDAVPTTEDNTISFTLTPQQMQEDVLLTVSASLNDESVTKTMTLYAQGNSEGHYTYESLAPLSDPTSAKRHVMINGRDYTLIPYSFTQLGGAGLNGIDLIGKLRGRKVSGLKVAEDYLGSKVLLKVYEGTGPFDGTSLVGDTGMIRLTSGSVDVGTIELTRIDDFQPIRPTDPTIELPPGATEF